MKNQKNDYRLMFAALVVFGVLFVNHLCADVVYHESGGMVAGEAEIYSERTHYISGTTTNGWFVVPDESESAGSFTNARGGAFIQCLPDNGSRGGPLITPEICYKIKICSPGTYRLYIRWECNKSVNGGGNSDSIFLDVKELKDGANWETYYSPTNQIADWYELSRNDDGDFSTTPWHTSGQAEINTAGGSGDSCDWLIPTQGVYTLRFTQREDGAAVDSFVFQLKDLPAPTGDGPAISSLEQSHLAFIVTGDTYLRHDQPTTPHGTNEVLSLENAQDIGASGVDHNIYLRFDISDMNTLDAEVVVTNATLNIYLQDEGIGTNHDIYVAVISEDATAEAFDEDTLTPLTSDVWNDLTDESVVFSKIYGNAPIGSFLVSSSNEPAIINFDDPNLLSAVRADTDGVFSLVLYRTMDNENFDYFGSKEHPSYPPPILELKYFTPVIGNIIILY